MGSAKVTDDGTAPAIAAIAAVLIRARREVIVLEGSVGRDAEILPLSIGRYDLVCVFLSRIVRVTSKQQAQRRFG